MTSRFFLDICLPLLYQTISFSPNAQSLHPKLSILKQLSRSVMMRSLVWSIPVQGNELISLLEVATQLKFVEIQRYGTSFTAACEAILSLPNLRHLTLNDSLLFDTPVNHACLHRCNLTRLFLRRPIRLEQATLNLFPLVDILHRLPKLKELLLNSGVVGLVLGRLLSNHSTPLAIDTLSIEGAGVVDLHVFHKYLEKCCSRLRTLSVPSVEVRAPTYYGRYLSSLEHYFGESDAAKSFVTPSVKRLWLTDRFPGHKQPSFRDAFGHLNATSASPACL
jgi:hypothetical protein